MAASDPDAAATQLQTWQRRLPKDLAAWAWASTARESAQRLQPQAAEYYQRAWQLLPRADAAAAWTDETLAWAARSALRSPLPDEARWTLVRQAIGAMSLAEQDEASLDLLARPRPARPGLGRPRRRRGARTGAPHARIGQHPDGFLRQAGHRGPGAQDRAAAGAGAADRGRARRGARDAGLSALAQLFTLGLRSEAVREWNFTLRDLVGDRQLLAAAQWACEREVWDRCINTSDRTRAEVDMTQRFPMPFRKEVVAQARSIGLDPAYVYGLIRQESRFIMDARSHVGASGLMQLMPATARWTAKKIGLDYAPSMITDRDVNLQLGTSYLKLALDDFQGSQAMAAAAYNAGPSRPRRWREGATIEAAAWAENIPFSETRDYVKKVLSNATYYAALINGQVGSLKSRLGTTIGPKPVDAPQDNRDLP